jgi:hypothetical protein
MEVTVDHLGAVQFEIHARQAHDFMRPADGNGGCDEGMTPPEPLLAHWDLVPGFMRRSIFASTSLRPRGREYESRPKS